MLLRALTALAACLLLPFLLSGQAEEILEAVRAQYAPDGRVARVAFELQQTADGLRLTGETNLPEARRAALDRLRSAGYELTDAVRLLPDREGLDGKVWGVVRLSAANMRSNPKHSAELSTQATLGTPLRVHKASGDWFLVQTPDDYLGWMDAGGFTPMTDAEWQDWAASERVVYLPDFGFSYRSPSLDRPPVSDLLAGNVLRLVARRADWVEVEYPDARRAFIPASEVQAYSAWLASREARAEPLLATARRFLGRPYLWGGTSGKGVDCSGFTKTVFYLHGLILPRDASQQVHVGYAVETDKSWANLRPGDLLFFGRPASGGRPERIVHVAIYQGNGRIIHAAGAVKENSLVPGEPDFNAYRYDTFVRARRVLDEPAAHGLTPLPQHALYRSSDGG